MQLPPQTAITEVSLEIRLMLRHTVAVPWSLPAAEPAVRTAFLIVFAVVSSEPPAPEKRKGGRPKKVEGPPVVAKRKGGRPRKNP
jgi:hypothetical protein